MAPWNAVRTQSWLGEGKLTENLMDLFVEYQIPSDLLSYDGDLPIDNGDGTWTFTFSPPPTADMEYLLVVDGVQENLISAMQKRD